MQGYNRLSQKEGLQIMRRLEFSIESNDVEIGKTYKVIEYTSTFYSYMMEDSLGMSHPIPFSERLKTNQGKVVEIKNDKIRSAILEFDE